MSREFLKKLGVMGVTLGLTASPFALAQQTQQDDFQTTPGQATDSAEPVVPQTQQQDSFGENEGFGQDSLGQDNEPGFQDSEPGFGDGPQSLPGESAPDPYTPGEAADPYAPGENAADPASDPYAPGENAADPYGTEPGATTGTGTLQ